MDGFSFLPIETICFFVFINVDKHIFIYSFSRIREIFVGKSDLFATKSDFIGINSAAHTL